jgi:CelD/BcsL family acetyltransferase involved in cellulose biosynthesis
MSSTQTNPATGSLPDCPDDSGALRGEWIATTAQFHQLAEEWNELFLRAAPGNAFLTFEWMFTWWKHWGVDGRLAIVAVRNPRGRLVALAPFYVARSLPAALGARHLSFLADTHVGSDYLGLLTEPQCEGAAVEEIARTLVRHRSQWDYLELHDAADGAGLALLSVSLEDAGMVACRTAASVCHHVPLPATFDEYLAGLSTNLRCNFRRRSRAIQGEGRTEFLALSDPADLERYFPELLRLHGMRSEQRGRHSAFLKPGVPAFHRDAVKALAARGWARLFLLRVDGETVAVLYGFSVGKTFQFYQCGMHTGWLRNGVGQLMIGNSIHEAIRTGHADYDFLRGDEPYKAQWAHQARHTVTLRFFDRRPASLAALVVFRAYSAFRRAKALVHFQ